ncbi:MAG: SDR family NAD(P)-dependent oxidoreductase [Propionibacteriaceae bacterium]|nr:SDR family NAD(P)-dependent oxidoreductase [Propionibacteriaceae bacterium]
MTGNPRTVVVTGGASGIGRAVAEQALQDGWRVLVIDRSERPEDWTDSAGALRFFQCDLIDDAAALELLRRIVDEVGVIDALVVSTGSFERAPYGDLSIQEWDTLFKNNSLVAMHTVHTLLPGLTEAVNRREVADIVVLSAIAGQTAFRNTVTYGSAAAATAAFANQLRIELRDQHIRVRSISPGVVRTQFFTGQTPPDDPYYSQPLLPEDVAEVVMFTINMPEDTNIHDIVMVSTRQGWA